MAFVLTSTVTDEIRLDEVRKQTGNNIRKVTLDDEGRPVPAEG